MGADYLPERVRAMTADLRAKVRLGYPWWLRPWLGRNVIAITLGRRIYLRPSIAERSSAYIERLMRHELAHVKQVSRHGLIVFLLRYVAEFLRLLWRHRSFSEAYTNLSFEVEARAAEESL